MFSAWSRRSSHWWSPSARRTRRRAPARIAQGIQGAQVPQHRTRRRRTRLARGRRAGQSAHLLRRDRIRRRVEVDRRRDDMAIGCSTISRSPRSARSPSRPATPTSSTSDPARPTSAATSPPATASTRSIDGGKTWTPRVEAGRTDRHDGRAPEEPGHRLRRGARPRVRPQSRARRLPHARRRQDWQQVLKKDSRHRRVRRRDRSVEPEHRSSPASGRRAGSRGTCTSGGPGSGLYVSRDGGDTWKQLTGSGLPEGIWGKVGVAIAPSDGRRVYALIEAEKGGLFRSDDGGENWELATANRALRQRAWYYTTLTVHPANPNEVWFPQVPMLKTIDGGKTIEYVKGLHHGDHHDLWFDPANPKRMIVANDGGVEHQPQRRRDLVRAAAADLAVLPRVGRQPACRTTSPARCRTSAPRRRRATRSRGGIHLTDWHDVGGGEAGPRLLRSERSEHRLRRRIPRHHHALRPPHAANRATSAPGPRIRPGSAART